MTFINSSNEPDHFPA